jgi:L-ascorbate metabolism protein UlaG (beta-lactamase superfamily)
MTVGTLLLHLGGVRFPITGRLRYTMTGRDAIDLCRAVQPRTLIPIHYEGWSHFQEQKSEIEEQLTEGACNGTSVRWLISGRAADIDV